MVRKKEERCALRMSWEGSGLEGTVREEQGAVPRTRSRDSQALAR